MKQDWTTEEIVEHFTLMEDEQDLLKAHTPHNKLGQAILLKFFQYEARFPESRSEIPQQAVEYLAQQLGLAPHVFEDYNWQGRSIKSHRQVIREFYGFRPATVAAQNELRDWLCNDVLPDEHRPLYLEEQVYDQLRKRHLEPPTQNQVKRLVTSAIHQYEQAFFARTYERLSPEVQARLYALIQRSGELDDDLTLDADEVLSYPIHDGSPR